MILMSTNNIAVVRLKLWLTEVQVLSVILKFRNSTHTERSEFRHGAPSTSDKCSRKCFKLLELLWPHLYGTYLYMDFILTIYRTVKPIFLICITYRYMYTCSKPLCSSIRQQSVCIVSVGEKGKKRLSCITCVCSYMYNVEIYIILSSIYMSWTSTFCILNFISHKLTSSTRTLYASTNNSFLL